MDTINELMQETKSNKVGGELITKELFSLCKEAASEGVVLLKNDEETLPILDDDKIAVFGRCAINWFYIGYGSGGDIKSPKQTNLMEALSLNQVNFDKELFDIYQKWTNQAENHPYQGAWGDWPRFYKEMELEEKLVEKISQKNNKAIVIIGRAAGEDRESALEEGSYYLTKQEKENLTLINKYFSNIIVILDCGNIMDLSWVKNYDHIKSIVYAWQGGMESCTGLVDVLTGKVNPSGRLTDTISTDYQSIPSSNCFGGLNYNEYQEDIYVGYRYFETFCKDKVLYPFGYGLSYSEFKIDSKVNFVDTKVYLSIDVTNIGNYPGKEVVQVYLKAPQGKLGKANMVLVSFKKTKLLDINEKESFELLVDLKDFASYDDSNKTLHQYSYVLEEGDYEIYVGKDCRNNHLVGSTYLSFQVIETLQPICSISEESQFERMVNNQGIIEFEKVSLSHVNLKDRILSNLPKEIKQTGDLGIKLEDVKNGKYTLDQFIAQLSDRELDLLTRGENFMDSKLGMSGNAGAFGGICRSLRKKGVVPMITNDGPSGVRFNGTSALLPCGTCLASSFNEDLIYRLYCGISKELKVHGSDVLLAPGMNIHRNPLCGRNFEYYSEDPYLTGVIASAAVSGIQSQGKSSCPKHFACNNQETNRSLNDSRVSERALREIYLKAFEYVVKNANPHVIMTSYNKVNGVWSHYNYDLATTILRNEWGYQNLVITDWWMKEAQSPEFKNIANNAYRVRAQVDVLMPGECQHKINVGRGYTNLRSLHLEGGITRGELQRSAKNVLKLILKTRYCK